VTLVEPGGPSLVRIDVRELVREWGKRDRSDQGVAIVADGASSTGTAFALSSVGETSAGAGGIEPGAGRGRGASSGAPDLTPYLELYVR
jgi:hypothetical protein